MGEILELFNALDYRDWLKLLGEEWTSCDNIREYVPVLKRLMGTRGPLRNMMTPEENAAYDALPLSVTVYREAVMHPRDADKRRLRLVRDGTIFMQQLRNPEPCTSSRLAACQPRCT